MTQLGARIASLALLTVTCAWRLPMRSDSNSERGQQAYSRGDYETALREFEAAERHESKRPSIALNRGTVLVQLAFAERDSRLRAELLRRAEELLREATGDASASVRAAAFYNLGSAFLATDELERAIESFKQALRIDPGHVNARHNLHLALTRVSTDALSKRPGSEETSEWVLPTPYPVRSGDGASRPGANSTQPSGEIADVEKKLDALEHRSEQLQRDAIRLRADGRTSPLGNSW